MALRRLSTSSLTNPKWYRDGSAGLGPYTDFELIDETVLTTSATSVTFSNLGDYSTIYKHLQIRFVGRSAAAASEDTLYIRFNGDTASNYSAHQLYGTGSQVLSAGYANLSYAFVGTTTANNSTASSFGAGVIDILDVYAAKNKTTRALTGQVGTSIKLWSGNWRNTNSVTSILLAAENGNLVAGSEFALFGIKGA